MPSTHDAHQQLKDLLAQRDVAAAQALWLDLAEQFSDQPEFLLLLVREFADAGHATVAAELASLIADQLKAAGKHHEWLFALRLEADASPNDKRVRFEIVQAYTALYESDPRFKSILAVSELDQSRAPIPVGLAKMDTLLALQVGSYCQQKSWGVGRVKAFDTSLGRIVVAFPHNPDHTFQLAYAAENVTPISADHIEVRKLTDLAGLQKLATNDPVALVRVVLVSTGRRAMPDRIEAALAGTVIETGQWKKWWDNTKKLLKRDPHFEFPEKRTDPFVLRAAPVSQQDELLDAFRDAPSLAQKCEVARQLLKLADELDRPELLLQEFQDGLLAAIHSGPAKPADKIEAAFLLEELSAHGRTSPETLQPLIAKLFADVRDLPGLLDALSTATEKRAVAYLKATQPDRLVRELNHLPAKALDEISDLLAKAAPAIEQRVRNQNASVELLVWLCRAITSPAPPAWLDSLPRPVLLNAVFNTLDLAASRGATKKLRDLVLTDETLLTELLTGASADTIRDFGRQLLSSTAFEELDRRSLMARVVKEFPFLQELLVTKTTREQPLIVSRASYDKRRAELDELITKRIPENSKEIGVARSYGDLRENFEFKAAKDLQRVLMRRRAELENLVARATPTDFTDVNTDAVNIGTTVTVTELATGKPTTYHILGAWDSDPARGIISYPAALAQSLLNKKVGDTVNDLRIEAIAKVPAEILSTL